MESFRIDQTTGLLSQAKYCASAHCDSRPAGMEVDLIVIHNISLPPNQFGTDAVPRFFCGGLDFSEHPYYQQIAALRVSSHLFIRRTGEIIQFVPFHLRAWHAGESEFQGRSRCNDFSIGIELEGADDIPYDAKQYTQLAAVIQCLMACFPGITKSHIVGHNDIAPARKTDPGPAFDWTLLKGMLI